MSTYAPARLRELREYLKPYTGLSNNELGIIGDENHVGGYHHGWDMRRMLNGETRDYSWNESPRDSAIKTNAASAIDIGMFARLRALSNWLVGQCEAQAPDTLDIRSIIYSPDGKVVRRWDRLRRRDTGDSSHLTHTHISFFRDAENRPKIPVFQRFFEGGEDTMDQYTENAILYDNNRLEAFITGRDVVQGTSHNQFGAGQEVWPVKMLNDILQELQAATGPAPVDIAKLVAALTPHMEEMVERAAERAVRKVFLDAGTFPPTA